jgi:hypothetical protein
MEHPVTPLPRRSLKIAAAAAAFAAVALTMPAARAAGEPAPGSIKVAYDPPANATVQRAYDMVRERNSLEMLREIFTPFRLPEDLYIKMTNCNGVPNAYFFRENEIPTIRICYEYLQQLYQMMPKEPTAEGITPREALVGQLLFAVAHEFGHAAFDIYNVPVFGRQEDAADQFATYFLLQFGGERAQRLIWGAAHSYGAFFKVLQDKSKKTPQVTVPVAAFSSDHGAPEERFYNLVCIAYGYDPKIFAAVVEKDYLPEARAKVCKYEYANLKYAVETMIMPHVDNALRQRVLATTVFPSDWQSGEWFP